MLTAHSQVVRNEGIVEAEIDGETVMMSIENGAYYGLDAIASRIWALLERPLSVQNICELLVLEFDVDMAQCQQDVLSFLTDMAERKVIQVTV